MNLANVYRQVLDIWGNPPYTELSPEAMLDCANRRLTKMEIDLSLTPNAGFRFAVSPVFYFNGSDARTKDLSGIIRDISRPIRVESRAAGSDDDWSEQRHASFENWNDIQERDGDFIAVYGMPPNLTMAVNQDASNTEFRMIYQKFGSRASQGSALDLPDIYEPYLVYDIALEVGELIDNQSEEFQVKKKQKMVYLFNEREEAKTQIEYWRKSQKGASVTTRRAFNDRNGLGRFIVHY